MRNILIIIAVLGVFLGGYLEINNARFLILFEDKAVEIRVFFVLFVLVLLAALYYLLFALQGSVGSVWRGFIKWKDNKQLQTFLSHAAQLSISHTNNHKQGQFQANSNMLKAAEQYSPELYASLLLRLIKTAVECNKKSSADKYFKEWGKLSNESSQDFLISFTAVSAAYFLKYKKHNQQKQKTASEYTDYLISILTRAIDDKNIFAIEQLILLCNQPNKGSALLPIINYIPPFANKISTDIYNVFVDLVAVVWFEKHKTSLQKQPEQLPKIYSQLPTKLKNNSSILLIVAKNWQKIPTVTNNEICNWLNGFIYKKNINRLAIIGFYAKIATSNSHLIKIHKAINNIDIQQEPALINNLLELSQKLEFTQFITYYQQKLEQIKIK